jgi:hypothetical protein
LRERERERERERNGLSNRMTLRPVLLWLTLNLTLIIQCLSRNNIYIFQFYIPRKMFSHMSYNIFACPQGYVYPRLKPLIKPTQHLLEGLDDNDCNVVVKDNSQRKPECLNRARPSAALTLDRAPGLLRRRETLKLRGLRPRENYIDRATAACRRS